LTVNNLSERVGALGGAIAAAGAAIVISGLFILAIIGALGILIGSRAMAIG